MKDEGFLLLLKIIGLNVRKHMTEQGICADELSKRTVISKQNINKIIEGNYLRINTHHLFILADILKISPNRLVKK